MTGNMTPEAFLGVRHGEDVAARCQAGRQLAALHQCSSEISTRKRRELAA